MRVMVVERYRGPAAEIYRRARERGRMLPDGVRYVDSWVDAGLGRCFQLMETPDVALLSAWAARWADLVEFEFVPVLGSAEVAALVAGTD